MKTICLAMLFSILTVVVSAQVQQHKDSGTIRLRCSGNIAANDVLYVVDGVPVINDKIKQLNPADIVSIDILKEADRKLISCRKLSPVIIITTKKANRKILHVVDAKTNVGVNAASVHIASAKTTKMMDFIADDYGRYETDLLIADESLITVTATGYKPLQITGKQAKQSRYRFELTPLFVELNEITVVAGTLIKCGRGNAKMSASKTETVSGHFKCLAAVVKISEIQSREEGTNFFEQTKIKAYPNPVARNGFVHLSLANLNPGTYQMYLFNTSGQLLSNFQKQVSSKNETEQFYLNGFITAGMYVVQVIDENKRLIQQTKLIVQ